MSGPNIDLFSRLADEDAGCFANHPGAKEEWPVPSDGMEVERGLGAVATVDVLPTIEFSRS